MESSPLPRPSAPSGRSLFALAFLLMAGVASAAPISLFDGKSTQGWTGDAARWTAADGVLTGQGSATPDRPSFLASHKSFRNFRLHAEYQVSGEGFVRGGILFRSHPVPEAPGHFAGFCADIEPGVSGRLSDEGRRNRALLMDPAIPATIEKQGDWNQLEIRCEGPRVTVLINHRARADYSEHEAGIAKDGQIALEILGGPKAKLAFRNLSIEELADDLVPDEAEILNRFGDAPLHGPKPTPFEGGKFGLHDGELIIFTGQTNFVREAQNGDLEAQLATAWEKQRPRFRSMAWEGDTVYEQWRDLNFGTWPSQLQAVGATMVVCQFGQLEALDGPARLADFTAAYGRLLDQFARQTPRLVIVSPMPFEKPLADHAPDLTKRNDDVRAYVEAERKLAAQRGLVFVDLFTPLSQRPAGSARLTDNGMQLTPAGLKVAADAIAQGLGVTPRAESDVAAARAAIVEKNHLWFDCWRPANWSFVYGDRITQPFGKSLGDLPSLRESFEKHKPLVAEMDKRIDGLAAHPGGAVREVLPPSSGSASPLTDQADAANAPEAEQASFTLADGYDIQLFASEKDGVIKPTQISWDEKGRMYVACSPTYPHLLAGAKPGDYIQVLQDTTGSGHADKSWRFAEGLTMVQGIEPGAGGLYVCDYDKLEHFRDVKGDGHGSDKKIIFSGFGVGDTHQLINSITHGPNGTLWFTQGLHTFSRVETPWGLARLDKAGVWRMHPRTLRLDAFFSGGMAGHNCWGVAFDDYNQVFHKSGDRPDGYYTVPGMIRLDNPDDYHPVGAMFKTTPKTTSLEFIGTKGLPDDVQGCALIGGYFGNVLEFHRVIDDGAGFRSEQLPKLLRSTSTSFRPVDVSIGPDGAIYVADWYNPIIGHYQASYDDPNRDKVHGRIWRITAKGHAAIKQPNLAAMSASELLDQMRSPERWTRNQAKRLLFDMPTDAVLAAADQWVAKLDPQAADYEKLLLEVIGVYEAHEAVKPALLDKLLAAKDARVRAYGTRVIGNWADRLPNALELLRARIHDENPRVRLEAVVACSYVAKPEAVEVAVEAVDSPRDKFISYSLDQCVRALKPHWAMAMATQQLKFGGNAERIAYFQKAATAAPGTQHPGKVIYQALCLNCHQPDGKGLPGVYPPLAGSEWVRGESAPLIKMMIHGLMGPITVTGHEFGRVAPVPMPPSGLTDQQIADVLTYVRKTFAELEAPVTKAQVFTVREGNRDRTAMWNPEELKK